MNQEPHSDQTPKETVQQKAHYFLRARFNHPDGYRLRHYMSRWWKWSKTACCYFPYNKDWLRSDIYSFYKGASFSLVEELEYAIAGIVEVRTHSMPTFLSRINSGGVTASKPHPLATARPEDIICFRNGIMDVSSVSSSPSPLADPTPLWFSGESCPFDYNPRAGCPIWMQCLKDWFGGDEDDVNLLREWMGYLLTSDTRAEKFMILAGSPRTGKSTVMYVVQCILGGQRRVASASLDTLSERFGLQGLVGKTVVQLQEVRGGWRKDYSRAFQRLISIVGRDAQNVEIRYMEPLTNEILPIRFMMALNPPLPKFPDNTGALAERILVLDFDHGIPIVNNPDVNLKDRITAETAGIFNWALEGLKQLRQNNLVFTSSASSREAKAEFEIEMNPLGSFVLDCLFVAENAGPVDKRLLHEFYLEWKKTHSKFGAAYTFKQFNQSLRSATGGRIREIRPPESVNPKRARMWSGISITSEAEKRFHHELRAIRHNLENTEGA